MGVCILGLAIHYRDWAFAAALALGFHCFLRPSEFLCANILRITLNPDGTGILSLPNTKSSERTGIPELITIDDPLVVRFISQCLEANPNAATFANMSSKQFQDRFAAYLDQLDCSNLGYRLYSIRRGGATYDYMTHKSLSRTVLRGRWTSSTTAKIYIQDAVALVAATQVADVARGRLAHFTAVMTNLML